MCKVVGVGVVGLREEVCQPWGVERRRCSGVPGGSGYC